MATSPTPTRPVDPSTGAVAATRGSRILLVDDNQDAAMVLADSLRALGHDVLVAHDGPTALVVVADYRPQVALLDLGLPVWMASSSPSGCAANPGRAISR